MRPSKAIRNDNPAVLCGFQTVNALHYLKEAHGVIHRGKEITV